MRCESSPRNVSRLMQLAVEGLKLPGDWDTWLAQLVERVDF